jgi:hypothetical protein
MTEEHKRKISKSLKGKQPKNNVAGWNRGIRKIKEITCITCGKKFEPRYYHYAAKYCSHGCQPSWNKGKQYIQLLGEKHWNWKGGITGERRSEMGRLAYKEWRKQVFEKDDYTCQECGQKGHKLHAHHIKNWATNQDKRYELTNGITLCIDCHRKTFVFINNQFTVSGAEVT